MKKVIILFLAAALVLGLAGCGKSKKEGSEWFDETVYEYAQAAYQLVSDYNRGNVSKEDAMERADRISKNVEALEIVEEDPDRKSRKETIKESVEIATWAFGVAVRTGNETASFEKTLKDLLAKY